MQTLQQDLDPSPQGPTSSHPVLRELMADQTTAYAQEIQMLRQRVAELETELAAAKAAQSGNIAAPAPVPAATSTGEGSAVGQPTSEFTAPQTPAVVAISEATSAGSAAQLASEPVSDPGFAQAWASDDDVSDEEQLAAEAFFHAASVDEDSRSWLLED